MSPTKTSLRDALKLDAAQTVKAISASIQDTVLHQLKRRGAVVGMSGGIDSSVVAALCVRALGKERVYGLFMPETDSSPDSLRLGRLLAESLGIASGVEDITGLLRAARCYERRDAAIRKLIPEYDSTWKCKIALPDGSADSPYAIYSVIVRSPKAVEKRARLTAEAYLEIVAATNFKQRVRKMMEYYHADRLQYAVAGTPNRLEYDQGFFVKLGDGAADLKPIAHLYKTQVYQLAAYLGVPEEILKRPPTTDTYSLEQSQEEFFFALPYEQMDLCLHAKNAGMSAAKTALEVGMQPMHVEKIFRMIDSKRNATRYLHEPPVLVEKVREAGT